jgi:stage II sporulation protein E
MNDADMWRANRKKTENYLCDLSDAFESLSEVFENLSDRLSRPGIPELRRLCDGVYDQYCPLCPHRRLCWEIEYPSSESIIGGLGELLASRGVASTEDLPEYMRSRCAVLPGIIGEINRRCAELTKLSGASDKTEVFAMDYKAVSELLADASRQSREELLPDRELTDRLTRVLARYGFGDGGVSVYGKREKHIVARGFDTSGMGVGMQELKQGVEKECGFSVSDPIIELGEGVTTLKMNKARQISATCTARVCNTGEEECGDTAISFETVSDKLCLLISDGMGRGGEAALTSGISSMFVQKMMGGGCRAETVIRMLSNFIRTKSGECSATVDLAEVDLLSGRCEFYKCGAAPSFVRRGSNVFKLSSNTAPLGILTSADVGRLSFDAHVGDVIFMMSDGVLPDGDECVWFLDLLAAGYDPSPEVMAEKIIAEARRRGSDDDVSVMIVKIGEAKK